MIAGATETSWEQQFRRHGVWIVVALAVAASITGITNDFAFDDVRAVYEDTRIHSLPSLWHVFTQTYWLPKYGASLYRPLTSLGFGLQWAIGGGSPLIFHVVSIVAYAAVCAAMLGLARQIFDNATALVGTAIFAVHPLHVEAVANVVGQAELGAALLVIVAVSKYLKWSRGRGVGALEITALCAMYGGALMFKEHAIVLPALLMATELLPSADGATTVKRVGQRWPLLVAMAIAGAVFVVVRALVIGKVTGGGDQAGVFIGQGFGVRLLTMLPVVLEWIRLFVWPASLSADYSSPRIDIATSFQATMLPAVAILLAVVAIAVYVRREHPSTAFAFAWSGITLLIPSNLIVVTGFVLAERALFLPSVGVSMLLGVGVMAALRYASQPMQRVVVAGVAVLIVAGIARSSFRNPVWKDNESLFRQTVEDVPYSWKSHLMLGEFLVGQGKGEGILEMTLGVKLAPKNDSQVRYVTARRLHLSKQQAVALPFYAEALAIDPSNPQIREDLAYCLAQMGRMNDAIVIAKAGLRLKPGDFRLVRFMKYADSSAVAGAAVPRSVN
ncbi:MAG TPA: tetratricopeptide repeat protein [Gemmatimonadaceae bacterium]|nr:tetratricopeptide repeat protein [Gemmatimonadaceae bacterium]